MPDRQLISEGSGDEWRRALVHSSASLRQAISNLDETGLQIALVVSEDGTLLGTLTDGDVRRALLHGLELSSPITAAMAHDPLVVPPELGRKAALQLMQANLFRAIPIVDPAGKAVGLHLLHELIAPVHHSNLMVLMAGGEGVRLRPHTENCPKPLLPVGGKPILEHIIERARGEGLTHFVIAVHYLGHMIEDYFEDGSRFDVEITYLREESPLGTAGALGLLNPKPDRPFLVSNGDLLTDIRYGELLRFHDLHGAAATMAVRLHEWQHPFGVVRTQGVDITGFEEKPVARSHINAGVYVLAPSALESLEASQPCDMPELFDRLQEQGGRTIAYPMHEPWLDVGNGADFAAAQPDEAAPTVGEVD